MGRFIASLTALGAAAALVRQPEPLQLQANLARRRRGFFNDTRGPRGCAGVGLNRLSDRIIGGTVVNTPYKYPFLAWIGERGSSDTRQFCAGTLISERVVLTAAHCLFASDARNKNIYVRLQVSRYDRTPGIPRAVINWRAHQNFSLNSMRNDAALLLLNESVPVRPIRLSNGDTQAETNPGNSKGTIVGWGTYDEGCANYDSWLREAQVDIGNSTAKKKCLVRDGAAFFHGMDFDQRAQICAGTFIPGEERGEEAQRSSCGDSGGPLLVPSETEKDTWVQVGIDSWSLEPPFPEVYTKVCHIRSWIHSAEKELLAEGQRKEQQPAALQPFWFWR